MAQYGGQVKQIEYKWVVAVTFVLGLFMEIMDTTIVNVAIPTLRRDFDASTAGIEWIVLGYLLALAIFIPASGWIGDRIGTKKTFLFALFTFTTASALCGLANGLGELIAFRILQGVGGGMLTPVGTAMLYRAFPPEERARASTILIVPTVLAPALGPVIGGVVDNLSWRWVFLINVPIGAAALILTTVVPWVPFTRREHKIDYLGSALLVAAVSCLLLVTVWGGNEYDWWSPPVVGLTLAGLALLVAFAWEEGRAKEPVLPLRLFRNQVFSVSTAGSFIVGFGMYGAIIYIPLYLEIVNDATPTQAGLQLTPLMLGLVAGSVGSGRIITRTGHYKVFPVTGMALMATGMFLLSLLDADSTRATQAAFMVVTGLGVGLVMQVLVLATQNAVEQRDLGTATSATSFGTIRSTV